MHIGVENQKRRRDAIIQSDVLMSPMGLLEDQVLLWSQLLVWKREVWSLVVR